MTYDPEKTYRFRLWGHAFTSFPEDSEPVVHGTIAEDPDNEDFYRCTVDEPVNQEYPAAWVGVYRVSKARAAVAGFVIPE